MSSNREDRVRASDRAHEALLDDILSGALPPGAVIGEVEQAGRLGISRTPVREAINRLLAEGLLVQQSPRVTVVASLDADEVRRLFDARVALECAIVRLAARNGAPFDAFAEQFAASAEDLATTEGRARYEALIADFDTAIDDAAANPYLTSALITVRTHLRRVRLRSREDPSRLAVSVTEHRLIAEALAAGDPDLAVHATAVHLHRALAHALTTLPEGIS